MTLVSELFRVPSGTIWSTRLVIDVIWLAMAAAALGDRAPGFWAAATNAPSPPLSVLMLLVAPVRMLLVLVRPFSSVVTALCWLGDMLFSAPGLMLATTPLMLAV